MKSGWIIIALILAAHDAGRPLRIGVSALTHQAIDTVLKKVVLLADQYLPGIFPGQCVKWGENRSPETNPSTPGQEKEPTGDPPAPAVEHVKNAGDLPARPWRLCLDPVKEEYNDLFGDGRWFSRILDPEKPVTLVLTDHQGCSQQSDEEADLMAALACRLICGHGFPPDRMAIISPHRAQNNEIRKRLGKMISDPGQKKADYRRQQGFFLHDSPYGTPAGEKQLFQAIVVPLPGKECCFLRSELFLTKETRTGIKFQSETVRRDPQGDGGRHRLHRHKPMHGFTISTSPSPYIFQIKSGRP